MGKLAWKFTDSFFLKKHIDYNLCFSFPNDCAHNTATMSKGYQQLAYLAMLVITLTACVYPISVYVHMMLMTLLTVYLGCHQSLKSTDSSMPQQENQEQLSTKDVYMFPIIGSGVLLTLYFVFKYLPAEYVNMVVKAYFFFVGCIALTTSFAYGNLPKNR